MKAMYKLLVAIASMSSLAACAADTTGGADPSAPREWSYTEVEGTEDGGLPEPDEAAYSSCTTTRYRVSDGYCESTSTLRAMGNAYCRRLYGYSGAWAGSRYYGGACDLACYKYMTFVCCR